MTLFNLRASACVCGLALFCALLTGCDNGGGGTSSSGDDDGPLVVYCAHDAVFSEKVLRDFEDETGIEVVPRFDTEASKSLGLVQLIMRERDRPRCDVFWNNEQLGMMQLQREGLLQPYKGEGFARMPDAYKDPDGYWCGFAARLRVWIVNTKAADKGIEADAAALWQRTQAGDLSRVAIAKPLFGTTRTHYTVFWDAWGAGKLKAWHGDWRDRGVTEVNGNGVVMNLVARGSCDYGLTDTDDFYVALDRKDPVAMAPFRLADGRVICIPNTVGIINGTKRLEKAKRLVEYLLSRKNEKNLAWSPSRQIPLGPIDVKELPQDVKDLYEWSKNPYPLSGLGDAADDCLDWLTPEYAR